MRLSDASMLIAVFLVATFLLLSYVKPESLATDVLFLLSLGSLVLVFIAHLAEYRKRLFKNS